MHYLAAAKKWSMSIVIAFGIFFSAVFVICAIGYAVGFIVQQFTLPDVVGMTASFKCTPLRLDSTQLPVNPCGLGDILTNILVLEVFTLFSTLAILVSPVMSILGIGSIKPLGVLLGLSIDGYVMFLAVYVSKVFDGKEPGFSRAKIFKHIRQAWLVTFGLMFLIITIIAIQQSIA